jgi:hypothetical protein
LSSVEQRERRSRKSYLDLVSDLQAPNSPQPTTATSAID